MDKQFVQLQVKVTQQVGFDADVQICDTLQAWCDVGQHSVQLLFKLLQKVGLRAGLQKCCIQ